MKARQEVMRLYGNRLRLRVCGVCLIENKIVMIRHRGVGKSDTFWCPPGGGIQLGESATDALTREFLEEAGVRIQIERLLFINEFKQAPLHALELFFEVKIIDGELRMGIDPEMTKETQIIQELRLMTMEEIKQLPPHELPNFFQKIDSLEGIYQLSSYIR